MSDNLDQLWTNDVETRQIDESPGVVEFDNKVQNEQSEQLRTANEKVISLDHLPTSPLSDAYDYGRRELDAERNGTPRQEGWFENQYYKPNQRVVFGHDISTGRKIMEQVRPEVPGVTHHMETGIKGLNQSRTSPEDGPDPDGMKSLANIAVASRMSGNEDYQSFAQQLRTMGYPESSVQAAWNIGSRAMQRRDVQEYLDEPPTPEEIQQLEQPTQPDLSREDLLVDQSWEAASKILFKAEEGQDFQGSPAELMDWTINELSNFNWRTYDMGYYAVQAMNRGGEYAQALSYLVNTYDRLPTDMDIFLKSAGALASDPINLVGFGGGAVGARLATAAAKSRLKSVLNNVVAKSAIVGGTAGAVEGPIFGAAVDASRQAVDIAGGNQEEYDLGRTGVAAGVGMGVGIVAGGVLGSALSKPAIEMYGRAGRQMLDNARSGRPTMSGSMRAQIGAVGDLRREGLPKEYVPATGRGRPPKKMVLKTINPRNYTKQAEALDTLAAKHPNPLESPEAWAKFERDMSGSNYTFVPPFKMIQWVNDMPTWINNFSRLTADQLEAAARGFESIKRMKKVYTNGEAGADITARLLLWGMLSRRMSAYPHEAGFLDAVNSAGLEDFIERALERPWTKADSDEYREWSMSMIPAGSPGRSATSNMNDFGQILLMKLSQLGEDGRSKLEHLHDLIADQSVPSKEVRREFYGMAEGLGIKNKVLSFVLLMTGREDVMIMDRIQINTLWDTERYGKLIYDDVAPAFDEAQGLARYEALERVLLDRVDELYKGVGRSKDASVGRYHWESWVLNSGQVVAHPTIEVLVNQAKGIPRPFRDIAAPEGRYHQYAYGAEYGIKEDGKPFIRYNDSKNNPYEFTLAGFKALIDQVKKPSAKVLPKNFSVKMYRDAGYPWYEAEGVNREQFDKLIEQKAEGPFIPEGEAGVGRPDEEFAPLVTGEDGSSQKVSAESDGGEA